MKLNLGKGFLISIPITLAICVVWWVLEYVMYGALQPCKVDEVVCLLFFYAIGIGFSKW